MQFSAFKGPFADRIDIWNGKLYMVSAWRGIQRQKCHVSNVNAYKKQNEKNIKDARDGGLNSSEKKSKRNALHADLRKKQVPYLKRPHGTVRGSVGPREAREWARAKLKLLGLNNWLATL